MSHVQLNTSSPSPGPPLVHELRAHLLSTQDVHMARLQALGQSRQGRGIIRVQGVQGSGKPETRSPAGVPPGQSPQEARAWGHLGAPTPTQHTSPGPPVQLTRLCECPRPGSSVCPRDVHASPMDRTGPCLLEPGSALKKPTSGADFPGERQAGGDQTSSQVPAQGTADGMKQASCLSKWPPA